MKQYRPTSLDLWAGIGLLTLFGLLFVAMPFGLAFVENRDGRMWLVAVLCAVMAAAGGLLVLRKKWSVATAGILILAHAMFGLAAWGDPTFAVLSMVVGLLLIARAGGLFQQ